VIWGVLCLSVLIGFLWMAGLVVFEGWSLTGFVAWRYALAWALVFLLVGVYEESTLRGYVQYTLARGIGFWWAALMGLGPILFLRNAGQRTRSAEPPSDVAPFR
jgi:hypothetical protein